MSYENRSDPIVKVLAVVVIFGMTILIWSLRKTPSDVYEHQTKVFRVVEESWLMNQVQLESSEEPYAALDEHGTITIWSKGAEALFGIPRSAAIGYGAAFIIPEEMRSRHMEQFRAAMSFPDHRVTRSSIECETSRKDGTRLALKIDLVCISGYLAIAHFREVAP